LATGSKNAILNFPGANLPGVMDSTEALSLEHIPKSCVIVGGGVIGVEFASLYSALGVKVTLIEISPRLLPFADAEIAGYLQVSLEADGVAVHTGAKVMEAKRTKDELTVTLKKAGTTSALEAETMLIAAGRTPVTDGIGLEALGVEMINGAIGTDEFFKTNLPGLYAIGDCNGKILLAHAAMAQGEYAAEHIMGQTSLLNHKIVPSCIYSKPELASVGLTQEQAITAGIEHSTGRFDLRGNARALIEGQDGFVKIIAGKNSGEVLGVHIAGPYATELIAAAAKCMSMEGVVEDIVNTVYAHPTVGESIREAAMSVFGKPIHGI